MAIQRTLNRIAKQMSKNSKPRKAKGTQAAQTNNNARDEIPACSICRAYGKQCIQGALRGTDACKLLRQELSPVA